jgi:hypothetical protein
LSHETMEGLRERGPRDGRRRSASRLVGEMPEKVIG